MSDRNKLVMGWLSLLLSMLVAFGSLVLVWANDRAEAAQRDGRAEAWLTELDGRVSRLEVRVDARMARIETKLDRLIERDD